MDLLTFKCPVCVDYEVDNINSLRIHAQKKHRLSARDLYVWLYHGDVDPKCACGCGETPKFWTLQRGFAKFVRGHQSRVNNNWGHNKEALQKSQDVRREMHKHGQIKIWNKGETKETDSRIASLGRAVSQTLLTDPTCQKQRSEHMSEQWKTGVIVPLTGSAHSQWKGGASALQPLVRSRLHATWVYPKLCRSGFKCQQCGRPGPGLEVHHDKERFSTILQKAIALYGQVDDSTPDDDFEKKSAIAEWVAGYHVENDVSGIVLCADCHAAAHAP